MRRGKRQGWEEEDRSTAFPPRIPSYPSAAFSRLAGSPAPLTFPSADLISLQIAEVGEKIVQVELLEWRLGGGEKVEHRRRCHEHEALRVERTDDRTACKKTSPTGEGQGKEGYYEQGFIFMRCSDFSELYEAVCDLPSNRFG